MLEALVSPFSCSWLQASSHSTFRDREFLHKDTKNQKEHCTDSMYRKVLGTYPKRVFDPKRAFNPERKTAHDFAVSVLTVVFSRGIHNILSICIKTISGSIKTLGCLFYIGLIINWPSIFLFYFKCFGFTLRREPKLPTWHSLLGGATGEFKKFVLYRGCKTTYFYGDYAKI